MKWNGRELSSNESELYSHTVEKNKSGEQQDTAC